MKNSLLILFILFSQLGHSDDFSCEKMDHQERIIKKSGLEIKSEPNDTSKTLLKLPYWTKVDACMAIERRDTINGTFGTWIKVKYGTISGFMFNGFLVRTYEEYEKPKDIRLMSEGELCSFPNFDPTLNWYGLYKTESGDSLINVEIEISKESLDQRSDWGRGTIFIKTNISERIVAWLLIGSKQPLTEKIVSYNNIGMNPLFLFPGQSQSIGIYLSTYRTTNNIDLNAIGTVSDFKNEPVYENYQLRLTDNRNNYKTQNISKDKEDQLVWYGDLDNDKKPDFILQAYYNNSSKTTLFLSSTAKNEDIVEEVDNWSCGYCN